MQRKSLLTEFCPLAFATGRRPLQAKLCFLRFYFAVEFIKCAAAFVVDCMFFDCTCEPGYSTVKRCMQLLKAYMP